MHSTSVEEARSFLLERTRPITEIEKVDTATGAGRVLAETICSSIDVPGYDNSAMDGYAVRSEDIAVRGETRLGITRRITAGDDAQTSGLGSISGQAARIFTGAPLPEGFDAVVMQEHCRVESQLEDDSVSITGPVSRGMNVRYRGNDIRAGTPALAAGTRLRPWMLGLVAAMGISRLRVFRRLRVALLSSGNELVQPGVPLKPGQCYDANRYTLFGLLTDSGCEVLDFGVMPDDFAATQKALRDAAHQVDLIITSGGVSVGEEDHIKQAVETIGRLDLWRVAVKPGKPLAYGRIDNADFIGLPGNPVSVLVAFCLFVRPILLKRQGAAPSFPLPRFVRADFSWNRPGNRREYARARLAPEQEKGNHEPKVVLFARQGSDVLSSAVWADGLVEIPPDTVIAPGDKVAYLSFAELLG
uniref:Molybdopterin molybdenumtransferase n=1 Tax=Candidatus Kentrum sp. MB TaxID=2138164 RepID=A0A450XYP6_9GAMM|nr:MAG: molybdopterin molybdotransferase [Candidatus Kentron sp. MB]VFK34410.1 MAG: molybdopterin molybdotransferase [Candidatus Kentron sp. MB]VFK76709.1 MAG: molybdopterin molybdotransferase [Candidatus Kentron sp. MB]